MKITSTEFIISAVGPGQYPEEGLPEIALAGRSNVGKSSLINRMIQRKNLARTSSQPGKTQTLNFYKINANLLFVDLPGYGFAKVSKTDRERWGKFIEQYLTERDALKLILLLVDIRHAPSKDDQVMYDWLKHLDLPVCVVATKADKVNRSQWQKHVKIVKETLRFIPSDTFILFSSETGMGRDELWETINAKLERQDDQDAPEARIESELV